jgi:DNA-binding FadR family transcriptional regulator
VSEINATSGRRYYQLWEEGRKFQLNLIKALHAGDDTKARKIMSDHMAFAETLMQQQELMVGRKFGDL